MLMRISIGLFVAAIVLILALEKPVAARSVSAVTGQARQNDAKSCFDYNFSSGAVTSRCSTDFIVPLTVDNAGNKVLTITGTASSLGAHCRVVANNRFGTAISASAFVEVSVGGSFVAQPMGAVSVPAMGVFFADCITISGTRFSQFDYLP